MKKINFPKLILAIIITQLAGIIGSIFTVSAIPNWYSTLQKPSFNPPSWIFGPVWTILYILIGISLYLVLEHKNKKTKTYKLALTFFTIQLILNTFWSIIFFSLKSPLFAFIDLIFLWVFIALTIFYFNKISKTASYLLLPYILWVTFAGILNLSIYLLN